MPRDARAYLLDVVEAATLIEQFTAGADLDAYRTDAMLRSAVERQLEIIGEALNRVTRIDADLASRVPDIGRIVGFRNVLAHGYDVVDDEIVWAAATVDAPALATTAAALLREIE
jgi:uncharacterized protein with HEPN domain